MKHIMEIVKGNTEFIKADQSVLHLMFGTTVLYTTG